ncbi:MAG: transposase [Ferruginibacter sp.]
MLQNDLQKQTIIDSLKTLCDKQLITLYAFVIMPNHIHLVWQQNGRNGKENPKGSFMKFTAHEFKKYLKVHGGLEDYKVSAANKSYQFWQRDSLSIEIWSRKVAQQKLDYIHRNPVSGKWTLAKDDVSYFYSSARFYEFGIDEFGFLINLYNVFDGD